MYTLKHIKRKHTTKEQHESHIGNTKARTSTMIMNTNTNKTFAKRYKQQQRINTH